TTTTRPSPGVRPTFDMERLAGYRISARQVMALFHRSPRAERWIAIGEAELPGVHADLPAEDTQDEFPHSARIPSGNQDGEVTDKGDDHRCQSNEPKQKQVGEKQ